MPTASEYNQFRRYIGDYTLDAVTDATVISFLNDTSAELTADFTPPVTVFDTLVPQFKPEVILRAAINWWWYYAATQTTKHSTTLGSASEDKGERWDRAMEMIRRLEERYDEIEMLHTDITIGNLSRFSKQTLSRHGGVREEDGLA